MFLREKRERWYESALITGSVALIGSRVFWTPASPESCKETVESTDKAEI